MGWRGVGVVVSLAVLDLHGTNVPVFPFLEDPPHRQVAVERVDQRKLHVGLARADVHVAKRDRVNRRAVGASSADRQRVVATRGARREEGLQNAMTSSEEGHVSKSRGLPHREVTDGLRRPPF